jgi:hypothetical protein
MCGRMPPEYAPRGKSRFAVAPKESRAKTELCIRQCYIPNQYFSKDIYRVPTDEDPNKYHWVDEKPLQYGADGDKSKTKKAREAFAVNIYHTFNEIKDEWYVGEVRVNSTLLHEALETILEGYPGLTQHELKSFPPPFLPFIHRWQAMLSYTEELPPSELKLHLQLL